MVLHRPTIAEKRIAGMILSVLLLISLNLSSCAGTRGMTDAQLAYPKEKVYGAGQADVWAAVIQTLNQMGFIIQFIDMKLGIIRASDEIRRDYYSFLSGRTYSMEIRIREVAPRTTMILIEYPQQMRGLLHDQVTWDPQANFFDYVEMNMG
jgi:hypothetical protein